MNRATTAFVATAILLCALSASAQVGPGQPFASEQAYREWLALHAQSVMTRQQVVTARMMAAATSATAPTTALPWYSAPKLTLPKSAVRWTGSTYEVALSDEAVNDIKAANGWAIGANAACACHGYDYLVGNGALYRLWVLRGAGEDPVKWLCEQGFDSPLATYNERWTINRMQDELAAGLTVARVQFNGKDYPATILPADCLAGCSVYAQIPCVREHQATVIMLSAKGSTGPAKCISMGSGLEFKCPKVQP